MSIKFCDEHLKLEKFVRAVYKLIFNEKWYYIGSTVDAKRRISNWKTLLQRDGFKKNSSMKFILPEVTDVRCEILEIVPDGIWHKEREGLYLEKCFNDELCLNITSDTINGKGRKLALGKKPKPPRGLPTPSKPVAKFDKGGKFIAEYKSIADAARSVDIKTDAITDHLRGRGYKTVKGFIFKLIGESGEYLEHEKYKDKIPPGRKFYQIDMNDNIVAEFTSVVEAGRAIGHHSLRANISRILNKEPRYRSCRGFTYRYA